MQANKPAITPGTKVGELLHAYPELEQVLLDLSPAFAKLKNPVLRKTIARVATLQQAAMVGGLKTDLLITRLRQVAGQGETEFADAGDASSLGIPDWYDRTRISVTFDATPMINGGESPMAEILSLARELEPGKLLELETPFYPAPIVDLLEKKGCRSYAETRGEKTVTYFYKPLE